MNILITGASGFVGTNLINHLSGFDFKIDVLDLGQEVGPDVRESFHWDCLDSINLDIYDTIIHLAGKAHDTKNKAQESIYFNVNYGLTKRIFDRFVSSQSAIFVFFSSVKAVAESTDNKVLTESVVPSPKGPYGESKYMAERYIMDTLEQRGQDLNNKSVYVFRPCMIHGPGNKGNLNLLYKVVKSGIPWPLGNFDNSRSFTSISNLNFIVEQVIQSEIESGVYNIADDDTLSTNTLIKKFSMVLNRAPRIWNVNRGLIKGLARVGDLLHLPFNSFRLQKLTENYVVSNDKIKRALGVSKLPVSAEDGLVDTIRSFIK